MENKDIHEWLLDEDIDSLTSILNIKGESIFLVDVLEKHLKYQLIMALKKDIKFNSTHNNLEQKECIHDWSEIEDMVFMCDKCGRID